MILESKINISEIIMQHVYFIKWPRDVSDTRPHCIYFVLSYRCFFKGFDLAKPYTPHQRETKLHCVHFVLWCSKLHHNVSLHLWHTIYIKMYELTYIRVASIHCHVTYHKSLLYCLDLLLIYLEHPDIKLSNSGQAVLQLPYGAK